MDRIGRSCDHRTVNRATFRPVVRLAFRAAFRPVVRPAGTALATTVLAVVALG